MDFVVVGFGLGALGVLLGLLLREAGAWWWRVRTHLWRPAADVAERVAYARACRAGGRILAMGGAVACGLTLVALLAGLSDRAGASVVVGSLTAIGFAIGAWAFTYAHRYHPRPARPRPRRGYVPTGTSPDDLETDALATLPDDATAASTAPPSDPATTDDRAAEVARRADATTDLASAAPPSETAISAIAAPVPASAMPGDAAAPAPAPAPAGRAPEHSADEPDSSDAESSGAASSQKPASAVTPDAERTPPDANAASPSAEDATSSQQNRSNRPLASIGKRV